VTITLRSGYSALQGYCPAFAYGDNRRKIGFTRGSAKLNLMSVTHSAQMRSFIGTGIKIGFSLKIAIPLEWAGPISCGGIDAIYWI
jgi:hypothetical protein